jgi:hypothetical protein
MVALRGQNRLTCGTYCMEILSAGLTWLRRGSHKNIESGVTLNSCLGSVFDTLLVHFFDPRFGVTF